MQRGIGWIRSSLQQHLPCQGRWKYNPRELDKNCWWAWNRSWPIFCLRWDKILIISYLNLMILSEGVLNKKITVSNFSNWSPFSLCVFPINITTGRTTNLNYNLVVSTFLKWEIVSWFRTWFDKNKTCCNRSFTRIIYRNTNLVFGVSMFKDNTPCFNLCLSDL